MTDRRIELINRRAFGRAAGFALLLPQVPAGRAAQDLAQQAAADAAQVSGVNVPIHASRASAEAAAIPASVRSIQLQYRAPTYADRNSLTGGGNYARVSKVFIDSFVNLALPVAGYFRSTDRFMPDGSADTKNGGYWLNADSVMSPEQFGGRPDTDDDCAPSITAMWTTATLLQRSCQATPGKRYRLLTTVDVEPHPATGRTAPLDLRGAEIKLGKDVPDISDEYAGIRYRGIHSGRARNVSWGLLKNGTIDANNIGINPDQPSTAKPAFSNGVITVMTENSSNVLIDNLNGRNYLQGYHVLFFRYTDGGAGGDGNRYVNSRVVGRDGRTNVRGTWNTKWYAHSSTCDLTVGMPGEMIQPGETMVLSTPRSSPFGAGLNAATPFFWTNNMASPVTVPRIMSEAAYLAARLTKGPPSSLTDEYKSSGGAVIGRPVVRGRNNEASNLVIEGGYYGVTSIGTEGHRFDKLLLKRNVRGLAGEWSAVDGDVGVIEVVDNKSSAFLLGYGCTGWRGRKLIRSEGDDPNAWVGEALFNIQLSSGDLRWQRIETQTSRRVATGQYHIHIGPDCSNVYIGPSLLRGDCARAWVAVESAWNMGTARLHPELYSSGDGWTAKPMHNIEFDGVDIEVDTARDVTATAFAILQVNDVVHGEAPLSDVRLTRCRAQSAKHVRALTLVEGAASPARNGLTGLAIVGSPFAPSLAATRLALPRGRAHFQSSSTVPASIQ